MYLIAKESDDILVYIYNNMNKEFTFTFKFDDFKTSINFQHTFEDFLKSVEYLCKMERLKGDLPKIKKVNCEFKFTLPFEIFRYVENLISPDDPKTVG